MTVFFSLAYMRPNSYCPLHFHDADESYLIVAGQALWNAGDAVRMRGMAELRYSLCAKLDISSQGELFGFLTKLSKSTSK